MSLVTVSTVLNDPDLIDTQLDGAVAVARATDAHLHILALSVLIEPAAMSNTALDGVPVGMDMADSIEKLKAMVAYVQEKMANQDVRWNMDGATTAPAAFASEVARLTRFSDLVVHQRTEGPDAVSQTRLLAEAVMFDADTSVLLLPSDVSVTAPPVKPLFAWDGSAAALRAARRAFPLLSADAMADIVMIQAKPGKETGAELGGDFGKFLSRHGVNSEISKTTQEGESVAATLERRALELGSDMLVMGAYGHSRLRQAIFGGTTRDLLNSAGLPVLMAH